MTNLLQIMQSSLKEYTFFPHQNKELMVRCRSLRGEHAALQLQVKEMGEENNRLKEGLREMESEKRYTPPPPHVPSFSDYHCFSPAPRMVVLEHKSLITRLVVRLGWGFGSEYPDCR